MPVGRPRLDDLLGGIDYWTANADPARGGRVAARQVDPAGGSADTGRPVPGRAIERREVMHARVAFYRLRSGSLEQVISQVESTDGLLSIFREQPGFQFYELVETGAGLISISHWEGSDDADAADRAAAEWVAEHIAELSTLRQSDTGVIALSSSAGVTSG